MRPLYLIILTLLIVSCEDASKERLIINDDIINFWNAYDKIQSTKDTIIQLTYLDSLFLQKGTPGLKAIIQARNYTASEYLDAINNLPKFYESIRANTLKSETFSKQLAEGVEKLRKIYPDMKPAKLYFTMGVFRTGGTALDSLVLIGCEMALTDSTTVSSEFDEDIRSDRRSLFDSNPIENVVLLNVHEYVHTQQKPMVHNLLSQVIYEGVAEFVSTVAMDAPSPNKAIHFGKENNAVKTLFEKEMFYPNNRGRWLWNSARFNDFNVRDLGYHIGYEMCERYYDVQDDKIAAIKYLIELDFEDEDEIEAFVDGTAFFSAPIASLYNDFESKRPTVLGIKQFPNQSTKVPPGKTVLTLQFSAPLNGHNTGIDYGPGGEEMFPKIDFNREWAEDNLSWTMNMDLEPNTKYQFLVSNNFRTEDRIPLKPYLVEFTTTK